MLAEYANDSAMIGAYKEGRDLYATIAAGIYKNDYWDNMEHRQDGSPNPEGKKRRSNVKNILLGIMYGRGNASIADQIGCSLEEATKIIDDFYKGFPKVKEWVDKTVADCKEKGYVEDFWGRRRRLPDIMLPKYSIRDKKESDHQVNENPLFGSKGIVKKENNPLVGKYKEEIYNSKGWKQTRDIKDRAAKDGIDIRDNGNFIAQAERQSVNSRVQGGAATMSKLAMIKVFNNEELRRLGFRIVLQIHDEIIGECPRKNAEEVCELLSTIMKNAAQPVVKIPFKADTEISPCWYYNDFKDNLQEEFRAGICSGKSKEEVYLEIKLKYSEITEEKLKEFLNEVL